MYYIYINNIYLLQVQLCLLHSLKVYYQHNYFKLDLIKTTQLMTFDKVDMMIYKPRRSDND